MAITGEEGGIGAYGLSARAGRSRLIGVHPPTSFPGRATFMLLVRAPQVGPNLFL